MEAADLEADARRARALSAPTPPQRLLAVTLTGALASGERCGSSQQANVTNPLPQRGGYIIDVT